MSENSKMSYDTLIIHLEALRNALLRCLLVTALLLPAAYWASPCVIKFLVNWSFPENIGKLHYFSPMEVFMVQLKLSLIMSLIAAYPWNMLQIWNFILPALYKKEKTALRLLIIFSSLLFLGGAVFCAAFILPLLMDFAASFSSPEITPILGISGFLDLAGWLMLAFGVMFQMPVLILPAVHFGLVTVEKLKRSRPYAVTMILVLAAILTPPDVISQLMLGIPAWLLFECGLFFASFIEKRAADKDGADDENEAGKD